MIAEAGPRYYAGRMAIVALDHVQVAIRRGGEEAARFPIRVDAELPGFRCLYAEDPFGNRIELLQPAAE